jgi:hypothetical protein
MIDLYIGIDPGEKGAIAGLFGDGLDGFVYDFESGLALQELKGLDALLSVCAMLERVHAFPKQGVSSVFKFGTNFGVWIGRLEALDIPYHFVAPAKWQKALFSTEPKVYKKVKGEKKIDTKKMSLNVARRLFPNFSDKLTRVKDNGRADALLIAYYFRQLNKGVF